MRPAAPTHRGAPADLGPSHPAHWLLPVGRSWQSIAAGYLGLLGLAIVFLAPFAIWTGVMARHLAAAGGHGMGRAIFGIVTGCLGTAFGIFGVLALL